MKLASVFSTLLSLSLTAAAEEASLPRCDIQKLDGSFAGAKEVFALHRKRRPVLFENSTAVWGANRAWEQDQFIKDHGDLPVVVRGEIVSGGDELATVRIPVRDYLSSSSGGKGIQIAFNDYLAHQRLRKDYRPIPAMLKTIHEEPVFALGREGMGAGLHSHAETWLAQVKGRKAWILAPPDAKELAPGTKPCDLWRAERDQKREPFQLCEAQPGDIIYLPEKWYHATCNLDDYVIGVGGRGDSSDWPPLLRLVADGEIERIKEVLLHGDETQEAKDQALMLVALTGDPEVAKLLLDSNANVHAQDKQKSNPVHLAAEMGNAKVLELFVEKRGMVHARQHATDKDGFLPLHWAARTGHPSIVEYLLKLDEDEVLQDVNAEAKDGTRPLHRAGRKGHRASVDLLLKAKADVAAAGTDGTQPLHWAAEGFGHSEIIGTLLTAGAEVSAASTHGGTPLHHAARSGHAEALEALVAAGADVAAADAKKTQAVHFSATKGHVAALRSLAALKADLSASAFGGLRAAHMAARMGHNDVLTELQKFGIDLSATADMRIQPQHLAANSGHVDTLRFLHEAGLNLEARDKTGLEAKDWARKKNRTEAQEYLAELAIALRQPPSPSPSPDTVEL